VGNILTRHPENLCWSGGSVFTGVLAGGWKENVDLKGASHAASFGQANTEGSMSVVSWFTSEFFDRKAEVLGESILESSKV
jgi:hypothetical protein